MRNLPVPVIAAINGPAVSFHLNSQSLLSPFENTKRKKIQIGASLFCLPRMFRLVLVSALQWEALTSGLPPQQPGSWVYQYIVLLCFVGLILQFKLGSLIMHRMGVTFTKLGLHPGMAATHFLPAVVGPQVTKK